MRHHTGSSGYHSSDEVLSNKMPVAAGVPFSINGANDTLDTTASNYKVNI